MEIRVGCSGFSYREWKEIFYPEGLPSNKYFEFYAEHFDTVELNTTFYHFPRLTTLQSWYNRAPADFSFIVKAPKDITHIKRMTADARPLTLEFYDRVKEGLQEKLGGILFQLPPSYHFSEEGLKGIVELLDPAFTNFVEFRHSSWWRTEVFEALHQHQLSFCSESYPKLPEDLVITADAAYYRFHGREKLYNSSYSEQFLTSIVDGVVNTEVEKAFLIFNNTMSGAALENARFVQDYLRQLIQ